ncbi:MAG: hypothetical protein AB3N12_01015 [Ruegeria sp.]
MGQRVLMLGRQRMRVTERFVPAINRLLDELKFDLTFEDLQQEDGYTETFFKTLGARTVDSLDISDFEGANRIHDLNAPVPEEMIECFDLVFDGGTTEHIFDVAACMDNLNSLLAPNGVLCACSPGNNWFAHGFYQFGPELVYGYWKHGCGFDVLNCAMLPQMPRNKELPIPDPAVTGTRPRMRGKVPNQRVYLYYEVRKGEQAHRWQRALQTDYVRKWRDHEVASNNDDGEFLELRSAHTTAAQKVEAS